MDQVPQQFFPQQYEAIKAKTQAMGFGMSSEVYIGCFLKTLVASKPRGRFLELGTGTGLSLAWMVDGMDSHAKIWSIDNDPQLIQVAQSFFKDDNRIVIEIAEGGEWLEQYNGEKFDLIFADSWPGKYDHLDKALDLLKPNGFYVIDDMIEQPNWPDGHHELVAALLADLKERTDLITTSLNWSSGVVVGVKKNSNSNS